MYVTKRRKGREKRRQTNISKILYVVNQGEKERRRVVRVICYLMPSSNLSSLSLSIFLSFRRYIIHTIRLLLNGNYHDSSFLIHPCHCRCPHRTIVLDDPVSSILFVAYKKSHTPHIHHPCYHHHHHPSFIVNEMFDGIY